MTAEADDQDTPAYVQVAQAAFTAHAVNWVMSLPPELPPPAADQHPWNPSNGNISSGPHGNSSDNASSW